MDVRNLNQPNADDLFKKLSEMQEKSPEIEFEQYNMEKDGKSTRQQLDELAEIVGKIESKLEFIFGNNCLVNGKFVDLTDSRDLVNRK